VYKLTIIINNNDDGRCIVCGCVVVAAWRVAVCSGNTPAQRPALTTTRRQCRRRPVPGSGVRRRLSPLSRRRRRRRQGPSRPPSTPVARRHASSPSSARRPSVYSRTVTVTLYRRHRPSPPPPSATVPRPSTAFTAARPELSTRNTSEWLCSGILLFEATCEHDKNIKNTKYSSGNCAHDCQNAFSFRKLCPRPPDQRLCPWTPLGAPPQTPVTGSRYIAYRVRHTSESFSMPRLPTLCTVKCRAISLRSCKSNQTKSFLSNKTVDRLQLYSLENVNECDV